MEKLQISCAINGRFLTRNLTGVDRYAMEITLALDELLSPGEAVLVVPEKAQLFTVPKLNNIELVRFGSRGGHVWEQIDFSKYLKEESRLGVNLCNTAPMLNPGVVCIHDMAIRANAQNFSRKFVLWYRLLLAVITRRAEAVLTVSEFSKREIEKYYSAAKGKLIVVPSAWQHIEGVDSDDSVLDENSLSKSDYWFAMSSLAPNKNLKWLAETARLNPDETVVIAGGLNTRVFADKEIPEAANVQYVGYVTDGQAKTLMSNCKGFLYPTFYEGFGLPPMEAIACGARAVVSDTEVMHEVYGDSVCYVNPYEPCNNMAGLLNDADLECADDLLSRYSWKKSAEKLYNMLCEDKARTVHRKHS